MRKESVGRGTAAEIVSPSSLVILFSVFLVAKRACGLIEILLTSRRKLSVAVTSKACIPSRPPERTHPDTG